MTDIRLHGIEIVDALEPLYLELQAHHAQVVPELAGLEVRDGAEAWAARRARYRRWFEAPTTFVVADAEMTGYALGLVVDGYDGWGAGEPIGEVMDLAVAAAARGRGLGSALLAAAEARFGALGLTSYRLNVLQGNQSAAGFYARRGLRPTATTFTRVI